MSHKAVGLICSLFLLSPAARLLGQITQVTNETATPIVGAGHDYRKLLNETVSPANGSLSVRIDIDPPASRGISLPLSIDYDSAGTSFFYMTKGAGAWASGDSAVFLSGGWSYSFPILTSVQLRYNPPGSIDPYGNILYTCSGFDDYVFTDSNGERHDFPDATFFYLFPANPSGCTTTALSNLVSSDGRYTLSIDGNSGNMTIYDRNGTVYSYVLGQGQAAGSTTRPQLVYFPSTIEDRNGNTMKFSVSGKAISVTDSAGRTAVSSSGFSANSSLAISGMGALSITWGTAPYNFNVNYSESTGYCSGIAASNGQRAEITSISLPNGLSYKFQYDVTYGVLNKVIYPNGAYTRYVWGLNRGSDVKYNSWPASGSQGTGGSVDCQYVYDTPAIQQRFVSFDGTHEVLEEDYSYSTTWGTNTVYWTKATTVKTFVSTVQNGSIVQTGSFQTVYNYTATPNFSNQYDGPVYDQNELRPLEASTVHEDAAGNRLQTVAKTWAGLFYPATQTTTLDDNSTSQTSYSYDYYYELKLIAYSSFGAGSPGPLLKQVAYTYQPFSAPGEIYDRPCKIVTEDGSGTAFGETDYYYDGGPALCSQSAGNATTGIANLSGHDETTFGPSATTSRGNPTKRVQRALQSGADAITAFAYDESGQLASVTDSKGNVTYYSFLDSYVSGFGAPSQQTNAYMTAVTCPATAGIQHKSTFAFRYQDGQLASSTDENGNQTSYLYNDPLLRPTEVDYPDQGKVTTSYSDAGTTPTQTITTLLNASASKVETTVMDGAGHPTQSRLTSDPAGTVYTDSVYDGVGRVVSASNPYRTTTDPTYGVTGYQFDGLSRITQITRPDGSTAKTVYTGPIITSTDEAGCQRETTQDALGRLIEVVEDPSATSGCNAPTAFGVPLAYATIYAYDPLDDLICVNQINLGANGSCDPKQQRARSFQYDSLKRLLSAANPETGTITYSYDPNGNIVTKTDARNIITCYGGLSGTTCDGSSGYDALNRPLVKSYSDGTPQVTFSYDGPCQNCIGHLVSVSNANSLMAYESFDPMGRISASRQTSAGGIGYFFSYGYDLAGNLTSENYPSGRLVTTAFDVAGHPISLTGGIGPTQTTYAAQFGYFANDVPSKYTLGNGLGISYGLNTRLQTTSIAAAGLLTLELNWGSDSNNGSLLSQTITAGSSTFTQTYQYDLLNRIAHVSDTGGWSQSFSYDPFGNLWGSSTGLAVNNARPSSNVYNAKNQMTTGTYDAAGNLLQEQLVPGSSSYDAEGRITQTTASGTTTYLYDGEGRRIMKSSGSDSTIYVYDAMGNLAAEYPSSGSTPPCTTCYLTADHLGSVRLVTDSSQNVISRHDYTAFGEEVAYPYGGSRQFVGCIG